MALLSASLPDISRLRDMPRGAWERFGDALRGAGFTEKYVDGAWARGPKIYERLQRAALIWQARRRGDRASRAFRLLTLRDPVLIEEASEIFGEELLGLLLDCGLFACTERGRVVSSFDCRFHRDLTILCDDLSLQGDVVFGVGPGSASFSDLSTDGSVLDVGGGAGAPILALSRKAQRAVTTEVNPRAVELLRVNAAINRIDNVQPRLGSLFEPVTGEKFDLIVAQPPFVPRAENAPDAAYRLAGSGGDEIARDIIKRAPEFLTPDGRAIVVFEQPVMGDGTFAAPPHNRNSNVLLLLGSEVEADAYCIRNAATELPLGLERYDDAVVRMREHLAQLGIRGFRPALAVIEHARASEGWSEAICTDGILWNDVSGAALDRLMAGQRIAREVAKDPVRAKVRIPDDSLVVRHLYRGGNGSHNIYLRLASGHIFSSLEFTTAEWEVLLALQRGESVPNSDAIIDKAARHGLIDG